MSYEKPSIQNDPYEFYYTQDLNEFNENEEIPNQPVDFPSTGLIGPVIAILFSLVIIGLFSVIYHRDKNGFTLWYLIMICFSVLVAGAILGILFMTQSSMKKNGEPNYMLIGIALILSITFFAYSLVSTIYIFMYRPFHYNNLKNRNFNQNSWKEKFSKDFNSGWGEDRRILWWTTFCSIFVTIGFLWSSITLWRISRYYIDAAKMLIGAGCFTGVILSCFAILQVLKARKYHNNFSFNNDVSQYLIVLQSLLIILIILLVINAVINLLKKKVAYFGCGILLLFWLFIFASFLGLVLRDMRKRQFQGIDSYGNCADILDSLHQDDIKSYCPNKYLNKNCSKDFMRVKWESDNSIAWLNPECCNSVSNYLFWPTFILGCLSLLIISSVLITMAFDFFLSNRAHYLDVHDKKMDIGEILFLGLIGLTLLAFLFVWIFYKGNAPPQVNPNNPKLVYSKYTKELQGFNDPKFKVIDLNKVYQGNIPQEVYSEQSLQDQNQILQQNSNLKEGQMKTKNQILIVKPNYNLSAVPENTGLRLGILVINGKIKNKDTQLKGTDSSRGIFFQGDSNVNNDYLMIFGKSDQLNQYLKEFQVSSLDLIKPTEVLFYGQQIDLKTLNIFGLKGNESDTPLKLSKNGNSFSDQNDFRIIDNINKTCFQNNQCESDLQCFKNSQAVECKEGFVFYPSDGKIKFQLPLEVLDINNKRVAYQENTLQADCWYFYNGQSHYLKNVILNQDKIEIEVPKTINSEILMNINLSDTSGHYLPLHKKYIIPSNYSEQILKEQPELLLTKSGKGCVGSNDIQNCFSSQQQTFGKILVKLFNNEYQQVQDEKLQLLQNGNVLQEKKTDENGKVIFDGLIFGQYFINFKGNDKYVQFEREVQLQSISMTLEQNLYLKSEYSAVLERYFPNSQNQDWDFGMAVQSIDGNECHVTPQQKWCAFSEHMKDISQTEQGYEQILIKKFTESNYLTFEKISPQSDETCVNKNYSYYPGEKTTIRSLQFDWNKVRKLSAGQYNTLYCFNGWGLQSKISKRVSGNKGLPSASLCKDYYNDNSQYSLNKLHELNA